MGRLASGRGEAKRKAALPPAAVRGSLPPEQGRLGSGSGRWGRESVDGHAASGDEEGEGRGERAWPLWMEAGAGWWVGGMDG